MTTPSVHSMASLLDTSGSRRSLLHGLAACAAIGATFGARLSSAAAPIPAPQFVLLALATIQQEPGSTFVNPAFPGPLLGLVETGTLTIETEDEVVVQSPEATPSATPGQASGQMVTVGDTVFTPAGASVTYHNTGSEVSRSLVMALLPPDIVLPTDYPEGVAFQLLAASVVPTFLLAIDEMALNDAAHSRAATASWADPCAQPIQTL